MDLRRETRRSAAELNPHKTKPPSGIWSVDDLAGDRPGRRAMSGEKKPSISWGARNDRFMLSFMSRSGLILEPNANLI